MQNITFALPDELKRIVDAQISAGHYKSASEYLRKLIRKDEANRVQILLAELLPTDLKRFVDDQIEEDRYDSIRDYLCDVIARDRDHRNHHSLESLLRDGLQGGDPDLPLDSDTWDGIRADAAALVRSRNAERK